MKFSTWWRRHGVALLSFVAGVIPGLLGIKDLIPEGHVKYWYAVGIIVAALIGRQSYTNQQAQK